MAVRVFHVQPLDPCPIRRPGSRVQYMEFAVMEGSRIVAVFQEENEAEAYKMHRNKIRRLMKQEVA